VRREVHDGVVSGHRSTHSGRIEQVQINRCCAVTRKPRTATGRGCQTSDLVTGVTEQRNHTTADDACRTGDENLHGSVTSWRVIANGAPQPLLRQGACERVRLRLSIAHT
jgi:hypothetical protein